MIQITVNKLSHYQDCMQEDKQYVTIYITTVLSTGHSSKTKCACHKHLIDTSFIL
jgi:hypothetical protein